MAEEQSGGLALPEQDAGAGFKAEMWVANTFLGYWKQLLVVIVIGLIGVLIYGMWANQYQHQQRATTGQIADVQFNLPKDAVPGSMTDAQTATFAEAAGRLDEIGAAAAGTARVEAYLNAAELYRMVGNAEAQRSSLENAAKDSSGALQYAAVGALANLDLEEGQGDAAVERLRGLKDNMTGMLSEQSTIDLGLALEHLEKPADAVVVYTEFLEKWPESTRADDVEARQQRIIGDGA